jgi:dsRNA-specific ribonuclease
LKDPRFDVLFFGSTALKAAMERENQHFYEAYHLERLEFVGDRIWSEVVAQSVFLLAPFAGSRVGLLNDV